MIDIDFLIELIKDDMLKVGEKNEHFYSITRNFGKKEVEKWETIYLYHPETSNGCHFEFFAKDWKQEVSKEDYARIAEFAPEPKKITSKVEKNQEILLEYIRKKIADYDSGANKKL